jgi:ABC-2 type transport system permease protein
VSSLRRIFAISAKEFLHIRREPRLIIAVLVLPVIQLLLFSYAISFDVKNVPTVVVDQDRSAESRAFLGRFENSDFFHVIGREDSLRAVDGWFDRSEARVAIVVPPGFSHDLARDLRPQVAVLVDGSEPNSAQLGQAYAVALSQRLSQDVSSQWAERRGLDLSGAGGLSVRTRMWYNPERESADFLIPGLLVVITMIVTIQQTATTLVREKDQGTLEQLIVSPIRRGELMVGKVLPWVVVALADVVGIVVVAIVVFGVPLRGSLPVLAVSSFLFVLCCLALGLLISARAPSLEAANFAGLMVSFLPGFMLSGFAFPLNSIPVVLQWISYAFPARYMMVVSRAVFLKGAGFATLAPQIGALALYAAVSLTLASLLYSRRL